MASSESGGRGASVNCGHGVSRSNLAERTLVVLQAGGWDSPDVLLVDGDRGPVVVKDFSPRRRWVAATLGRWLIRREIRALDALRDHPAVPRLLGSIDPLAFVLEHRAGVRVTRRRPRTFGEEFLDQLGEAVTGLHERGVAHLDLRHRSNIRAGADGRPVIIDFDSALVFRPQGWGRRFLLPVLARFDRYSLRKWQRRLGKTTSSRSASCRSARGRSAAPGDPEARAVR